MSAPPPESPPPVLAYDNLPADSGITLLRDDDGTLTIQVPTETFRTHVRWAVRSPRMWTLMVIVWVSQSWLTLWQSFRSGAPLYAPQYWPQLLASTIASTIAFVVGALIISRHSATIRLSSRSLSIRREGRFAPRPREWERALIRDVRADDVIVMLSFDRPSRKPRKVPLIGNRDQAELAWIAQVLRDALNLEVRASEQPTSGAVEESAMPDAGDTLVDSVPAPCMLQYADRLTAHGVWSQTRPDGGLRVGVPPVPGWRHFPWGFYVATGVLACYLAVATAALIRRHDSSAIGFVVIAAGSLFFAVVTAFYHLHRRLIFEVTPEEVSVVRLAPWFPASRHAWSRREVGDIHYSQASHNLIIRITGKDLIEFHISVDPRVTQWVAQALNEALSATPTATVIPRIQPAPATRIQRRVSIACFCAMIAAAGILIAMGFPWSIAGMYLAIFSAVPIGMTMGTQEREYYL